MTRGPTFGNREAEDLKKAVAAYIKERQEDPDLVVPAGGRARYEAAFARFSSVFPAFCLREHGRFYPITSMDKGRFLGAGYNVMGYFRDDAPLIELILDETERKNSMRFGMSLTSSLITPFGRTLSSSSTGERAEDFAGISWTAPPRTSSPRNPPSFGCGTSIWTKQRREPTR